MLRTSGACHSLPPLPVGCYPLPRVDQRWIPVVVFCHELSLALLIIPDYEGSAPHLARS